MRSHLPRENYKTETITITSHTKLGRIKRISDTYQWILKIHTRIHFENQGGKKTRSNLIKHDRQKNTHRLSK